MGSICVHCVQTKLFKRVGAGSEFNTWAVCSPLLTAQSINKPPLHTTMQKKNTPYPVEGQIWTKESILFKLIGIMFNFRQTCPGTHDVRRCYLCGETLTMEIQKWNIRDAAQIQAVMTCDISLREKSTCLPLTESSFSLKGSFNIQEKHNLKR